MKVLTHLLSHLVQWSRQRARWHSSSSREALPCAAGEHNHHGHVSASSQGEFAEDRALPPKHPHTLRVRRLAAKLIAATCDDEILEKQKRRLADIGWRVDVIDDMHINAFARDDGEIKVCIGMLRALPNDADALAILGHEVGHVIARHCHQELRKRFWVSVLVNFIGELLDVPGDRIAWDSWETLFMRPHLFRRELEADRIGLRLVAAAGYHPRIAPGIYWNLHKLCGASLDDYDLTATHPPDMERAQRLSRTKVMDEALELYRKALSSGKGDEPLGSAGLMFHLSIGLFWIEHWLQRVPVPSLAPHLWSFAQDLVRNRRGAGLAEPGMSWARYNVGSLPAVNERIRKVDHHGLQSRAQECPFCNLVPESAAHIAFNCYFAKQIWKNILSCAGIPIVLPPAVPSVDVWWRHLRSSVAKDKREWMDVLVLLIVRHLCLERNARLFREEMMTSTQLTIKIKKECSGLLETPAPTT